MSPTNENSNAPANSVVPITRPAPLVLTSLQDSLKLGEVLAMSGFFGDARTAAQAVVKVLAGRELGFAPIASMTGIHIIEGKPVIGSHLMASMIKRSGRYDYRVVELTAQRCELEFTQKEAGSVEVLGRVALTIQEAVSTGLAVLRDGRTLKANWSRHADDMLFARCISKGYRRYCPDLAGGLVTYTEDEIESPAAPGAGEVVDASYTTIQERPGSLTVNHVQDAPPAEATPANFQQPAREPEHLTEAEEQELVALARAHKRTTGDVKAVLAAAGVPTLSRLPRRRLEWARLALQTGMATTQQTDAITALVNELKIPWQAIGSRLEQKYQVSSIGHLLPSQAAEVEAALSLEKTKRQAAQPSRVPA